MNVQSIDRPHDTIYNIDEILQDIPEKFTEELPDTEEIYQSYKEELNQELKTTDRVWLEFHAGQCEQFGKAAKSILYRVVKSSVNHPENSIAAANAITILKVMSVSFACLDLKRIKIPHADLSGAILDRANFSKADLTLVNLKNASLNQAKMKKAILKGVNFGLENFLTFKDELYKSCYIHEANALFIMTYDGNVYSGYILDTISKTIKELYVRYKTKEDVSKIIRDLTSSRARFFFISSNKIGVLCRNVNPSYVLYTIDILLDQSIAEINNTPVYLHLPKSNQIVALFRNYLVTAEVYNKDFFSVITFERFNIIHNRYEKCYSKKVPYRVIPPTNILENGFSPTNPFLVLQAFDSSTKFVGLIFNYETREIVYCMEYAELGSQFVFSEDMQYLAFERESKASIVSINTSNATRLLNDKQNIEPTQIDYFADDSITGQLQIVYNNKKHPHLIFVNKNNELKFLNFSTKKNIRYPMGFIITKFYLMPKLNKIIVCGNNMVDILPIDKAIDEATPVFHKDSNASIDKAKAWDFCVRYKEGSNKQQEILYYINYDWREFEKPFQIVSCLINSDGLLRQKNDRVDLEFKKIDDISRRENFLFNTINSTGEIAFSPNSSYIISIRNSQYTYSKKHLLDSRIIELNTFDGKLFYTFPEVYSSFTLSSDDKYLACTAKSIDAVEDEKIQIWDLPSKSIRYTIEKYPFDTFEGTIVVSKNYLVLGHTSYIRVIPVHNKLGLVLNESFSHINLTYIVHCKYNPNKFLFYNDHTLVFATKNNIYLYDLENSSKTKRFAISGLGVIQNFDISISQAVIIFYLIENEKTTSDVTSIFLLDITTGKIVDKISYKGFFKQIRFSNHSDSIVGWNDDQIYIWHIRQGKLCLMHRSTDLFESHDLDITGSEISEDFENLITSGI